MLSKIMTIRDRSEKSRLFRKSMAEITRIYGIYIGAIRKLSLIDCSTKATLFEEQ